MKISRLGGISAVLFLAGGCAPTVTGPSRIDGEVGLPLANAKIEATNSPESFGASGLPDGLAMTDPKIGVITGMPERSGIFNAVLTATNRSGTGRKSIPVEITRLTHPVVWQKELFITNENVLMNSRATQVGGPWHFSTVMRRLAGTDDNKEVSAFTLAWLRQWKKTTPVNGDPDDQSRNRIDTLIINPWIAASDGKEDDLNWSEAPLRLIGIVNRIDLTKFSDADALKPSALGEARLVFADKNGAQFYAIFEFQIPGPRTKQALISWARRWRVLGDPRRFGDENTFGEDYMVELQKITDSYVTRTGMEGGQVRTNEFKIGSPWELREFGLEGGDLTQRPVKQTPQIRFNNGADTPVLRKYLEQHARKVLNQNHEIPIAFEEQKFIGGVAPFKPNNSTFRWNNPGLTIANAEAVRFNFSFNTCTGCHGGDGQGRGFVHIANVISANQDHLSPFLSGPIDAFDPAGNPKMHNERDGRMKILARIAAGDNVSSVVRFYRVRSPLDVFERFRGLMAERVARVH